MNNNNNHLRRKGKYSIAEVFEYIDASPRNGQKINFHGDSINMREPRMLSFKLHGIKCISCGIQGAFFAKEYFESEPPHLNLYGFNKYGREVLMTRDHIKPRAKGGTNGLFNLQTMCSWCNNKKADHWSWKDKTKYVVSIVRHWFLPKF